MITTEQQAHDFAYWYSQEMLEKPGLRKDGKEYYRIHVKRHYQRFLKVHPSGIICSIPDRPFYIELKKWVVEKFGEHNIEKDTEERLWVKDGKLKMAFCVHGDGNAQVTIHWKDELITTRDGVTDISSVNRILEEAHQQITRTITFQIAS